MVFGVVLVLVSGVVLIAVSLTGSQTTASVDAVCAVLGATGMVLLGFRPLELFQTSIFADDASLREIVVEVAIAAASLALAAIVPLRGKARTRSTCRT